MNKIYKLSALWMMCLMLLSCFTACNNGEEEDTNQYKGGISLNVFGPCPVARGGELRFLGSGMDQVTAVVIPGCDEITGTDIKVVSNQEIRVMVPQSATVGTVMLKTPKGEILTKTDITYSEPVALESFSPVAVKAGDVITIKGEYLNLIKEVIFADGVVVTGFVSQSRSEIKVAVPVEAQTGKVIISDGAEIPNWIYSATELSVKLPAITSIAPNPLKAGQKLTVTGTDFDLVAKVILPGGQEVEVENATTQIEIESPEDIKEGEVILVAKSGVEVKSAELKLVKPAIASISSASVKNNASFTITGTNLDLVSTVVFEGAETSEFTSQSATQLVLTIPATAKDGKFTLKTLSDTEIISTQALTFVKPAVSAFSESSIKAQKDLTLTGTNLDLVTTILFGTVAGEIKSATSTTLVVNVPVGAVTGPLTLKTDNGTEVITTQTLTIDVTLPEITSIVSQGPGKKITVVGTQLDLIQAIYLADENGSYSIRVLDYGIKTDTKVEFYHIKGAAQGWITPKMVTWDGDQGLMPKVYCAGVDEITAATKMIMDFNTRTTSDWHGVDWDNWGGSYDADASKNAGYLILNAELGWWIIGCNHPDPNGGWPSVNSNDYVLKMDIKTTKPVKVNSGYDLIVRIGGEAVSIVFPLENGVLDTQGDWITIKMNITGVLSNPTSAANDFGLICNNGAGTNWSGLCMDNVRFDPK